MVLSSVPFPAAPTIDAAEARWASDQLGALIANVGDDSVAGLILRQARQELASLVQSAGGEVVGPLRVRVAA
jgi:hypothetical protein